MVPRAVLFAALLAPLAVAAEMSATATPKPRSGPDPVQGPPPAADQAPHVFNAEAAAALRQQGVDKLLFVRRFTLTNSHVYTEHVDARWTPGGGLACLDLATGAATDLLPPEFATGVVNRFDLSFDATRVVFDFKKSPTEGYRLFELTLATGAVRQLTFPTPDDAALATRYKRSTNDMHPCYLPDGGIAFSSTRCRTSVLCDGGDGFTVSLLHRLDGTTITPLSHGSLSEFSPVVLPDGRILYMRWEYNRKGAGAVKCLWSMRPDGTASAEVYGNQIVDPETMIYGRPIPGTSDKISFLGASHWGPNNGVGTVIVLDTKVDAAQREAMTFITTDVDARTHGGFTFLVDGKVVNESTGTPGRLFKDPYPLSETCFLAAGKPKGLFWHDPKGFSLMVLDGQGRDQELYRDQAVSCWHPYPLRPRKAPPTPATATNEALAAKGLAHCVVTDVYAGLTGVERGTVKWLRVLEQVPRPWTARRRWTGKGDNEGMAHTALGPDLLGLQVQLGVVPVEADGSASLYIPADRNIYFQVLDANFMAIQTERTFINYRPGEIRSCTGCHERSHAVANRTASQRVSALQRPPSVPGSQPGETTAKRVFDYQRQIQPIWDRKCVSCHDATDKTGSGLDLSGTPTTLHNISYDNLLGLKKPRKSVVGVQVNENDVRAFVAYTQPYALGAHTSLLAATVAPVALTHLDPRVQERVPALRTKHKDALLSTEEFIQVTNWLDAGCQYHPSYWGRKHSDFAAQPFFRPAMTYDEAIADNWPSALAPLYEDKK